jgi:hypothetical protein
LAWAVDPLAFRVGLPPQATLAADELPVVVLADVPLLLLPHADNITAPIARTLSPVPNRLSFK